MKLAAPQWNILKSCFPAAVENIRRQAEKSVPSLAERTAGGQSAEL